MYDKNHSVYGIRKVWSQLQRDGFRVTRGMVVWLMATKCLTAVFRGKKGCTTFSRKTEAAYDWVNCQFVAERLEPLGGQASPK